MKANFKISILNNIHYLYPYPVVKNKKYLVKASNSNQAMFIIKLFESSILASPIERQEYYFEPSLHTDEQTKIFSIRIDNIEIKLPNREVDLKKSIVIEKVIKQKIINIYNNTEKDFQLKLEKQYKKMLNCRNCRQLGINYSSFALLIKSLDGSKENIS